MDATTKAFALHFLSEGFQYPDASWDRRFRALLPRAAQAAIAPSDFAAEELEPEHFRLFGPAPACPQELALHLAENPFEQARIMAHMAGFYRAFGLEQEPGERPDNLAVALSFLSFLHLKARHAEDQALAEAREVTEKAILDFTRDFLAPGAAAFCGKLPQATSQTFYLALAERLRKEILSIHAPALEAESRWRLRDDDMGGGEMTCGALKQPLS